MRSRNQNRPGVAMFAGEIVELYQRRVFGVTVAHFPITDGGLGNAKQRPELLKSEVQPASQVLDVFGREHNPHIVIPKLAFRQLFLESMVDKMWKPRYHPSMSISLPRFEQRPPRIAAKRWDRQPKLPVPVPGEPLFAPGAESRTTATLHLIGKFGQILGASSAVAAVPGNVSRRLVPEQVGNLPVAERGRFEASQTKAMAKAVRRDFAGYAGGLGVFPKLLAERGASPRRAAAVWKNKLVIGCVRTSGQAISVERSQVAADVTRKSNVSVIAGRCRFVLPKNRDAGFEIQITPTKAEDLGRAGAGTPQEPQDATERNSCPAVDRERRAFGHVEQREVIVGRDRRTWSKGRPARRIAAELAAVDEAGRLGPAKRRHDETHAVRFCVRTFPLVQASDEGGQFVLANAVHGTSAEPGRERSQGTGCCFEGFSGVRSAFVPLGERAEVAVDDLAASGGDGRVVWPEQSQVLSHGGAPQAK